MANGTVNKVILVGRLGQDPELRYAPSGTAVCKYHVATNHVWKDSAGEKKEKTEWHNCVAFGKLAEIISEYTRKGSLVFLAGRIQSRKWEDNEGREKRDTDIVTNEIQFLGPKKESEGSATPSLPFDGESDSSDSGKDFEEKMDKDLKDAGLPF